MGRSAVPRAVGGADHETPATPAEGGPRSRDSWSQTKTHLLERNPTMTPKPRGVAARAGHWSARHRKTAIIGWLVLMIAVAFVGNSLGQQKPTDAQKMDGETRRAETILEDAGFPEKSGEMVLVQSKTGTVSDPQFAAAIKDAAATIAKVPVVANVASDTVSAD